MLVLENVTLCCVDTANQRLALRALQHSRNGIRFGRALLLTDSLPDGVEAPAGIEIVPIAPIVSRDAYSHFILKSLLPHIATTHVLLMQWDGYVCNPDAWDPAFLDCDYIGAKWFWHNDAMRIGNGGFSLRSRRLLEALQDPRIALSVVEDETICRTFRPLLERDYGIRFADEALADRFAFEAAYPIGRPFGFHGLFNFCRVMPGDELARLPASFDDAIARSPQLLQLLRNCMAMGQWAAATAIAERILAVNPASVEVRTLLSQAQSNAAHAPVAGRNDPCPCGSGKRYKHCHGAVNVQGGAFASPDALFAHALQAHQGGDLDIAERGYRAVLAAAPEHAYALHYLGVIHYQHNRPAEALPLLERAVERVPQEAEFHNNLGLALAAGDRFDEAIAAHRRALNLNANHPVAWNNLGLALQAMNELPAAIDAFHHALKLNSDFAQAHWNLGLALLAVGESADGWREYEWRLRIAELGKSGRTYPGPRWTGENPTGKTILLTREQGFGDTLQFVRFSRMLAERGARVLLELQEPLARLLASAPGVSGVCDRDPLPAYDAHLPLLSVAGVLGITATTIPCEVPYLTPNPRDVTALAAQLEPYRGQRNIGLSWAGSAKHVNDRRRSCPLAMLTPLLEMPGINWFSLQKNDGEDEIAAVPAASRLIQLDARNDFDRKAALVAALDLVISVDTSNAHLAGALARPVWVLLPFAADWRWHLSRSDSPWYPTARLFRQPRIGDWNAVIADVQRALATSR
jgi:tetratricopeptide (TPR) repeat protein